MFGKFSFWRKLVGRSDPHEKDADRRVWVRYPANLETTYRAAGQTEVSRFSARIRDISRGGANLIVDRSFQAGELLSLELPTGDSRGPYTVLACIVRVNSQSDGEWSLGCVFSRELEDQDLQGLGARRQRPAPSDQRLWMRFPCQVGATYQKLGNAQTLPAKVLNISASGVGLLVEEAIETGTLLTVELSPSTGARRTMLVCVVHANSQEPGQWALGCNFIEELSEDDLHALLKS